MLNSTIAGLCSRWLSRSRVIMSAAVAASAGKTPNVTSESAPEDPTLVQVVYVTRHGLRTPLSDSNDLMKSLPWECVSAEETLRAFTEDLELYRADEGPERGIHPSKVSRSRLPPGRFDAQFNGDKLSDFGKNCHSGQLTLAGHLQMRDVGRKVGERYKKKLGLLGEQWRSEDIHVRSTNSERTIETALEIIRGMYPDRRGEPLRVELHSVSSETMYPHSSCGFIGDTWKTWRASEVRANLKSKVSDVFDKSEFESEDVYKFFARRSLPALCNTLATLVGHGFPLPRGIKADHADTICDFSGVEYGAVFKSDKRLMKLGIGRFLGEVLDVLKGKVEYDTSNSGEAVFGVAQTGESAPPKFVIMSGHDNTLAPLILSLGLHDGLHTPMGSGLAFELYQKKGDANEENPPEYFVQTVYNFTPLPIPACDHKVLCPFEKFSRIVAERAPSNYHSECENEAPFVFEEKKPKL